LFKDHSEVHKLFLVYIAFSRELDLSSDVSFAFVGEKHQIVDVRSRLGVRSKEFFDSDQLKILGVGNLSIGSNPLHAIA
jgi:hypothetical protein